MESTGPTSQCPLSKVHVALLFEITNHQSIRSSRSDLGASPVVKMRIATAGTQ